MNYLRSYWQLLIIFLLLILTTFVWYVVFISRPHDLRFAMLDVGQGLALYIESPNGNKIIVDGGSGDALLTQISKVMPLFDRRVDMIVTTDTSLNDFEGFVALLDRYDVGVSVQPEVNDKTSSLWNQFQQKIINKKIPVVSALRNESIDIGGGAYIDIIFSGNSDVVVRLVYGKKSVLITGNANQQTESYVMALGTTTIESNILQVPDGGSKNSLSDGFVKMVQPDTALISVAKNNTYGLPAQITLDTLSKNNVQYVQTANEGIIEYDSDGQNFVRVK